MVEGILQGADEIVEAEPGDQHETLYFALTDRGEAGFVLTRSEFTDAEWQGDVLRITLGPLVIEIDPT